MILRSEFFAVFASWIVKLEHLRVGNVLKRVKVRSLLRAGVARDDIVDVIRISPATYYRILDDVRERRSFLRKEGSGRRSKLEKNDKIRIHQCLAQNPFRSALEIRHLLHLRVSHSTVRRYLNEAGFVYRKPKMDFELTPEDKVQRIDLAKAFLGSPYLENFVFVDESTFWLNDNNRYGWFHKSCEHPLSMNKHKGKVHACAGISIAGKIDIITFRENFYADDYTECLRDFLVPAADLLYPMGWFLVQDNGPCHKGSAIVFVRENLAQIPFPKRSPDLNPIENIWHLLKQEVRKKFSKTMDELEDCIHEEWKKLNDFAVSDISFSFESRLSQVIKSNGERIQY